MIAIYGAFINKRDPSVLSVLLQEKSTEVEKKELKKPKGTCLIRHIYMASEITIPNTRL
jgi:hypothetical protein